MNLHNIRPETVSFFQDSANALKKGGSPIWSVSGKGHTGNHIQFPVYKIFASPETENWRVELKLARIKCLAVFCIKNKCSAPHMGNLPAAKFFFDSIMRIAIESKDFETAKGHYQCLVGFLAG
jgi:hypothetical protein